MFEERIDFVMIKRAFKGLNKRKPTSSNNALALMHENENMNTVYLEETKKNQKSDLPIKRLEEISSMTFAKFKKKLKNYLFDKSLVKIICCS